MDFICKTNSLLILLSYNLVFFAYIYTIYKGLKNPNSKLYLIMFKIFSLLFQLLTSILCCKIFNKFIDIFASNIFKMFPAKGHKSSQASPHGHPQGSPHGHPQGSPGPGGPNRSTVLASGNSKHDESHKKKKISKRESIGLYLGELSTKYARRYTANVKQIKVYEDEAIDLDYKYQSGKISYETYCKEMNFLVGRMKKLNNKWIKDDNFDAADSIDINKEYQEYNKKYSSEYLKYENEKNKKNI